MHNAPSVVFPVGRCAFQGWLLVVLGMVGAAVGALFLVESDFWRLGAWGWLPGVTGMCVWLIWAAWAFANWRRSPEGSLRWDARQLAESGVQGIWAWTDRMASEPVELSDVERVLDLQSRVLLRICGPGMGRQWVWVESGSCPARWNDLRRALVSGRA